MQNEAEVQTGAQITSFASNIHLLFITSGKSFKKVEFYLQNRAETCTHIKTCQSIKQVNMLVCLWPARCSVHISITHVACVLVALSYLTLYDSTGCSPPGSSVHGILQARILEWIVFPFSRGFSWPKDWTQASRIVGRFFAIWATSEVYYTC